MPRRTTDLVAGDRVRVTYHHPARGMVEKGVDVYEGTIARIYQVPNKDWHVKLLNSSLTRNGESLRSDRHDVVLVHPHSTHHGIWEVL